MRMMMMGGHEDNIPQGVRTLQGQWACCKGFATDCEGHCSAKHAGNGRWIDHDRFLTASILTAGDHNRRYVCEWAIAERLGVQVLNHIETAVETAGVDPAAAEVGPATAAYRQFDNSRPLQQPRCLWSRLEANCTGTICMWAPPHLGRTSGSRARPTTRSAIHHLHG